MDFRDLFVFVGFWGISLSCVIFEDVEGWLGFIDLGEVGVFDEEVFVDFVFMLEVGDIGFFFSIDFFFLVLILNGCFFLYIFILCW